MRNLVTNILETTTKPENWDFVLDQFNTEFNVTGSCMFAVHEFENLRMNFAWSKYNRDHLPQSALEMMQSGGDVGDVPAYNTMLRMPPQIPTHETELFGVKYHHELPPSNVRDITNSLGLVRRTAATLNKHGPWIDGFFVQMKSQQEADRFVNDARVEIILPIIANSVSLSRILEALKAQYRSSLAVLDNLGIGVFLIDQTGCIIQSNKEAQRILDLSDGIMVSLDKRLRLLTAEETSELYSMISNANNLFNGDIEKSNSLVAASRPSGKFDFLISVRPLSDDNAELEVGFKSAFVTVIDPDRKNVLSADGLKQLGQLSPAETSVVELLIQGLRIVDVADQRDVSINTVKTQLKDITQKLRCSSQGDIIRVAAATRIPIQKNTKKKI